jgi:hypothetical protein
MRIRGPSNVHPEYGLAVENKANNAQANRASRLIMADKIGRDDLFLLATRPDRVKRVS